MSNQDDKQAVDFHCHNCGAEVDSAPDPPAKALCENCCEDHDYRYCPDRQGTYCWACDKPAPGDWDYD